MSKENGFLQLRRGIWEHVRNGQMNVKMLAVYIYILSEADTRTGVWKGCAKSLSTALRLPLSTVKYALCKLDGVYIRRFVVKGRRFCYPILCHKFVLTDGPDVGRMLDALNSTNAKALTFFPEPISPDILPESVPDVGRQKRIENREGRKKQADKAPADPRFGPFLEFAKASFETKHGHPPTWDCFGKDGKELAEFLRRAAYVTIGDWQTHISNFFDSTEPFTIKQGGSLSYFVRRFDTFANGPILAQTGGGNGKLNANEAVAITMQGAAVNARRVN